MKKLFQNSDRQPNGSGTRGKRRLVRSRETGHSSSSDRRAGSHFTGLRSMITSSGTITVRDQYETSYRLKTNQGGESMISTGIAGMPFQSYSPNSANWILVKTSALTGPPRSRMRSRARTIASSSAGTPASFMAKYALIVADRLVGPPAKRVNPPSGRC